MTVSWRAASSAAGCCAAAGTAEGRKARAVVKRVKRFMMTVFSVLVPWSLVMWCGELVAGRAVVVLAFAFAFTLATLAFLAIVFVHRVQLQVLLVAEDAANAEVHQC